MAPVPARPERRGPAGSGIFGATIRIAAERRGAAILRNILKKVVNISSPGGRGERVIAATLRDSIGQVEDGLRRRFPGLLPEVLIPPSPLGNQGGTRIWSASAKKVGPRHDRTRIFHYLLAIIRPATSLMILTAAAAVMPEGSRVGLHSTTSRPMMSAWSLWITSRACRVDSPPGS